LSTAQAEEELVKFRWRRHRAQEVNTSPATPKLSDADVLQIIKDRLDQHFGCQGTWSVSARTDSDTDFMFREFLTKSLAADLAAALQENGVAVVEERSAPIDPAWQPEPITVWAEPSSAAVNTLSSGSADAEDVDSAVVDAGRIAA
jgi:hypothetical protein